MTFRDATFFVAAVGHLALALVSLSRSGKNPLAMPLALLAFDFFGWSFATLCNHLLGGSFFGVLDAITTAMAPPLVLHGVLAFVGKLRARRGLLQIAYGGFACLAASSATGLVSAAGRAWVDSSAWGAVFLAGWLPMLGYGIVLLRSHLRGSGDAEEQARTRLVLAALAVGGVLASTDLVGDFGISVPRLAPVGTLVSTTLLAVVALRFRLFDRNLGATTTLYAVSVAAAAILVYLTLFQGLSGNLPALTFGVTLVTLILSAIVREATSAIATQRERVERLAVLGRFSAQMAHDLKNPLAALVGAVQILEAEAPEGSSREFHALIRDQAARIRTIVETYDRLGRVEPVRSRIDVNALVERVTGLQSFSTRSSVAITLDLDSGLETFALDPDLVAGALENMIRNAIEAHESNDRDRKTVIVRTRALPTYRGSSLVLEVEDDAGGMDPRAAERAFDDFFTTKATGSGLGLAFVRRVALAHGGDASLTSRQNAGTTVQLRLSEA